MHLTTCRNCMKRDTPFGCSASQQDPPLPCFKKQKTPAMQPEYRFHGRGHVESVIPNYALSLR